MSSTHARAFKPSHFRGRRNHHPLGAVFRYCSAPGSGLYNDRFFLLSIRRRNVTAELFQRDRPLLVRLPPTTTDR